MVLKLKVGDRVKLISMGRKTYSDWKRNMYNTGIIKEVDGYCYDVIWDYRKGSINGDSSGQLTDEHVIKSSNSTKLENVKEKLLKGL